MVDKPLRANKEERVHTISQLRYQRSREKTRQKKEISEEIYPLDCQIIKEVYNRALTKYLQTIYPKIDQKHINLENETPETLISDVERIKKEYSNNGLPKILELNESLALESSQEAQATGIIERTIIHYRKLEGKPIPRFRY